MIEIQQRLAEIKERAHKATPGPWKWIAEDGSLLGLWKADDYGGEGLVLSSPRCKACQKHDPEIKTHRCLWPEEANANFIENSKEDIDWLLKVIDQLLMGHPS